MVGAADVLAVVAEASGIPVGHLSQTDWQPLAQLEARLRQHVAGQEAAVAAAVGAVRLGRLGLHHGQRPLASLLLTGPAGVGKATLCHTLAGALFGSDRHLLRLNLAEYGDRASGELGPGCAGVCGRALRLCWPGRGRPQPCTGVSILPGPHRYLQQSALCSACRTCAVSRLVGAPPGYVGYGDGGLLTEAVRWVGWGRRLKRRSGQTVAAAGTLAATPL